MVEEGQAEATEAQSLLVQEVSKMAVFMFQ